MPKLVTIRRSNHGLERTRPQFSIGRCAQRHLRLPATERSCPDGDIAAVLPGPLERRGSMKHAGKSAAPEMPAIAVTNRHPHPKPVHTGERSGAWITPGWPCCRWRSGPRCPN